MLKKGVQRACMKREVKMMLCRMREGREAESRGVVEVVVEDRGTVKRVVVVERVGREMMERETVEEMMEREMLEKLMQEKAMLDRVTPKTVSFKEEIPHA